MRSRTRAYRPRLVSAGSPVLAVGLLLETPELLSDLIHVGVGFLRRAKVLGADLLLALLQSGLDVSLPLAGGFIGKAYGLGQPVLYENGKGYRAGNKLALGLLGEGSVVGKLRASLGGDVVHEAPERWEGAVEQDGNLGRTDVLVGATVSHPVGQTLFSLGARVPVYTRLVETHDEPGQLSYPVILSLTVGAILGSPSTAP